MARRWRVCHGGLPVEPGAVFALDPAEAHHVRRVLRLQPGEALAVFDGRGREWGCRLVASGPREVTVQLQGEITEPVEPAVELSLFPGLFRAERMEWLIQKATELGAAAILAIPAARSAQPGVSAGRLQRWQRIALEACKQSGRRVIPRLDLLPELPSPPSGTLGLLLDTGPEATPLGQRLAEMPPRVWIAFGPEGGFGEPELAAGAALGWQRTSLGPRILRVETAGLAAAAIVLHRGGDLG